MVEEQVRREGGNGKGFDSCPAAAARLEEQEVEIHENMNLDSIFNECWRVESVHSFLETVLGDVPESCESIVLEHRDREGLRFILQDARQRFMGIVESLRHLDRQEPSPDERRRAEIRAAVSAEAFEQTRATCEEEYQKRLASEGLDEKTPSSGVEADGGEEE